VLVFSQFIGVGFMALYLIREPALPALTPTNLAFALVFGLLNASAYVLFYKALDIGEASIVAPISSTFNVIAPIVSFLVFRESFSALKIAALALVVVGVALTAFQFGDLRSGVSARKLAKGVPYALIWVLIWGVYLPFWDRFVEGDGWVVWAMLVKLVLVVSVAAYATFLRQESLAFSPVGVVGWLVFIGFCETVATLGISGSMSASVNTTSIVVAITSAYPLVTVLLALALLKERLAANQGVGVGLILTGMVLLPFI
jgi:uncharacterized membrane protein